MIRDHSDHGASKEQRNPLCLGKDSSDHLKGMHPLFSLHEFVMIWEQQLQDVLQ